MTTQPTMQSSEEMAEEMAKEMAEEKDKEKDKEMAEEKDKEKDKEKAKAMAKKMAEYLFKNDQINTLIEQYNKVSGLGKAKLRLETYSPYIYVVVVNKPTLEIDGKEVLLVKVGFTQVKVKAGTHNRMEDVRDKVKHELERKYKFLDGKQPNVLILCKFLIHALDIRPFRETEIAIREKVGFPLPKEKAKEWGLPVHTEWALTTQKYIDKIKKEVDDLKDENEVISTKIFKSEPGDNRGCNLARALKMTDEELTENLKGLQFPLEKADSPATAKKATKKSMSTPEKSPPAGESATPGARAIKTPGKTSSAGASETAEKGSGKKPSATDSLPGTPNTKDEDFTETVKELSLSSEEAGSSASAKKATEKTMETPEKSPPPGESSTPGASATKTPGKTSSTGAARPAARGRAKKP